MGCTTITCMCVYLSMYGCSNMSIYLLIMEFRMCVSKCVGIVHAQRKSVKIISIDVCVFIM